MVTNQGIFVLCALAFLRFSEKGEGDAKSIVDLSLHVFRVVAHTIDHYKNHEFDP